MGLSLQWQGKREGGIMRVGMNVDILAVQVHDCGIFPNHGTGQLLCHVLLSLVRYPHLINQKPAFFRNLENIEIFDLY